MRRPVRTPLPVLALAGLLVAVGPAVAQPPDQEAWIEVSPEEEVAVDAGPGAGVDGGSDAGVQAAVDAGPDTDAPAPPVPKVVDRWIWADGGHYQGTGATDRVEVRVGHWVEVKFYRPAVLTVCDAPLVAVNPSETGVRFVGLDAGTTQCGFWFGQRQPYPDRLVDVVVSPATP